MSARSTPDSKTVIPCGVCEATNPSFLPGVTSHFFRVSVANLVLSSLPMRKVILGLGISLDGYIARPDGSVDFLFMPKDYSMAPFFKTVDTALMGRKTYEVGLRMSGGKFDSYGLDCYVFSRTLPAGESNGLTFVNDSPLKFTAALGKRKGKHIWLMGGGELARDFLKDDLVDELYLGVVPVLIGEGLPLFPPGFPQREFTLLENRTFSRGLIALKYARCRTKPKSKSKPNH